MNYKRNRHTACSFSERYVYVFGGLIGEDLSKMENTIELFDFKTKAPWIELNINLSPGIMMGAAQINNREIILFGGFNGK